MIKTVIAALFIGSALLAPVGGRPAQAEQGVSIDLGSVAVDQELSPGGRYRLPTLTVRNIGDEQADYEVIVVHLNDSADADAPEAWFDLEPKQFHLAPQEARLVEVHIVLPSGADPGRYNALVEARVEPEGDGVRVSAAAASRVSFEVKPSNLLAAWILQVQRTFADQAPWSYLALGMVLLLILVYVSRRYIRLRVGFERRP